eukprot:2353606-Pleurochrysis_carterae.AAC.1
MLWNTNSSAPEASLLGVRLTEDTYRRLRSNTCSTATLATLPEEFRRWNRSALEEAAQRRAAAEGEGSSGVPPGGATPSTAPPLETRQAEAPGEAGSTVENTEDAEPEAGVSGGPDGGDDAESDGQAEHDVPDTGDATKHSSPSEADEAEGGGEEDDSQVNPDRANSGDPGEHAEAPARVDGPDDPPPEGVAQPSGPAVQEPTEEPAYEYFKRQVRLCQTPEVCYLLPPEAT